MGLSEAKVQPTVPVSDIAKAKEFYEGKLGLSGGQGYRRRRDRVPVRRRPRGSTSTPRPATRANRAAPIAGWEVDDLEKMVDELTANGVNFEQYDSDPIKTNRRGLPSWATTGWPGSEPTATPTASPRSDRPLAVTAHRC